LGARPPGSGSRRGNTAPHPASAARLPHAIGHRALERPAMVRVSLKNTFLAFDASEELDEQLESTRANPSKAASPRSRSVECMSPSRMLPEEQNDSQIQKLNRLLDADPLPSPSLGPSRSPTLHPSSPGTSSPNCSGLHLPSEGFSQLPAGTSVSSGPSWLLTGLGAPASSSCSIGLPEAFPTSEQSASPSGGSASPPGGGGPSAQELKQLRRRLEEACQLRGRAHSEDTLAKVPCEVHHVTSTCSVSTMAADSSEESDEVVALQARSLPTLPKVRSSNSVCSMASELIEEYTEHGATVEFDLTIEEGPKAQTRYETGQTSPCSQMDGPWVQRQPASPRRPQSQSFVHLQRPVGRGPHSPSGPRSPTMAPRGSLSQWRPLPKEYRHGHVPKNLNLEQEYRSIAREQAPTTLMIRNIPNRYTQRELIMELEDLGFTGTFDFLYIPLDKGTMSNVGYAFVNFVEPAWAEKCMAAFQNYRFKRHRKISGKIATISVAHIQGLEANLAHYENAAVNTAKLKQRRPVIMANISNSLSAALSNDD